MHGDDVFNQWLGPRAIAAKTHQCLILDIESAQRALGNRIRIRPVPQAIAGRFRELVRIGLFANGIGHPRHGQRVALQPCPVQRKGQPDGRRPLLQRRFVVDHRGDLGKQRVTRPGHHPLHHLYRDAAVLLQQRQSIPRLVAAFAGDIDRADAGKDEQADDQGHHQLHQREAGLPSSRSHGVISSTTADCAGSASASSQQTSTVQRSGVRAGLQVTRSPPPGRRSPTPAKTAGSLPPQAIS